MDKQVKFYPLSEQCKKPFGAIKANDELNLTLQFSRPSAPAEVLLSITKDGEKEVLYPFEYVTTHVDGMMEYKVSLKVTTAGLYFYHFVINTDYEQYQIRADRDLHAILNRGEEWQLTVYEQLYETPSWLKGGVIYQIMPDRFFDGGARKKTKTNVVYRDDWGAVPNYLPDENGKILNNDFFGGNLRGIIKKLAYLKSLGVTCIYLNPIFEAYSNHKYDTGHYRKVDPDFGTLDDLKELIKKADKKGIKILLDGVFSHTGDDSIYFNKYGTYDSVGAYQSTSSAYSDWYSFKKFPDEYDSWWNIDILPETREDSASFTEYICGDDGIIKYWTELGLGGWRLDVADELPDAFLDRLVKSVKSVNPQALVLGEVWEDASNKISYSRRRKYFLGSQLDSVTNYPFKEDILNFVRSGDAERLAHTVNVLLNNYPKHILDNLMNMLDTHDTARLISVLGDSGDTSTREARANATVKNLDETIKQVKVASLLQFTLMGVPCIYYGDEAGLQGFEDPFNRRCIDWNNRNKVLTRWYKLLGAMRARDRDIFADGEYKLNVCSDGIYSFDRIKGDEVIKVIANCSGKPYTVSLDDEYTNVITLKPFDGKVANLEAVAIKLTKNVTMA